jgi:hypothetical protein
MQMCTLPSELKHSWLVTCSRSAVLTLLANHCIDNISRLVDADNTELLLDLCARALYTPSQEQALRAVRTITAAAPSRTLYGVLRALIRLDSRVSKTFQAPEAMKSDNPCTYRFRFHGASELAMCLADSVDDVITGTINLSFNSHQRGVQVSKLFAQTFTTVKGLGDQIDIVFASEKSPSAHASQLYPPHHRPKSFEVITIDAAAWRLGCNVASLLLSRAIEQVKAHAGQQNVSESAIPAEFLAAVDDLKFLWTLFGNLLPMLRASMFSDAVALLTNILLLTPLSVPAYDLQLLVPVWNLLEKQMKQELQKQGPQVSKQLALLMQLFVVLEEYACARDLPDQFQ